MASVSSLNGFRPVKMVTGAPYNGQAGIYFENDDWREHNLGTKNSLIAFAILANYYSELSKHI